MTLLTFKVKRLSWVGGCCGILDIQTDKFTTLGGQIHKYLLELDGKSTLSNLKDYVGAYVDILPHETQDDAMLFESISNSFSSGGSARCTTAVRTSTL